MEHTPQAIIGIEDHKSLTDDENLAERLAIIIASQNRPYLHLDHSLLNVRVHTYYHTEGSDPEVNLAFMVETEVEKPNLVDE